MTLVLTGAPMWRALQGAVDRVGCASDVDFVPAVYTVNDDYDAAKDIVFEWLPDYVAPPPGAAFDKWVFPIIANVAPQANILEDLVAVQPMTVPAGHVFYMDFVHTKSWRYRLRRLRSYLHDAIKNLLRWLRLRTTDRAGDVRRRALA